MARPNFRLIKSRVTLLDVLARYGVELRAFNQYQRKGKCPLPTHTSEGEPSFVASFKKAGWVWACHSSSCVAARNVPDGNGGLKKGGDLIDFVRIMEKCSLSEAGERLNSWFGPFEDSAAQVQAPPQEDPAFASGEEPVNRPLGFTLKGIQFAHPFLTVRGFDPEECEYLGVGFFSGKGSMQNRIVFPIHNERGELVAYAGRRVEYSLHDEDPTHVAPECPDLERWKFPAGFHRGLEVYNLNRVVLSGSEHVVVVESFWGVLGCVRAGIMNAVAIMSNNITDAQAELIARNFKHATVMLDGDEAGRGAISQVVSRLDKANIALSDIALVPRNLQPDTMDIEELRLLLRVGGVPCAWTVVEEAIEA